MWSLLLVGEFGNRGECNERDQRAGDENADPPASAHAPFHLEAAPALVDEMLFPIVHVSRGPMNRSAMQDQPAIAGCDVQALAR